jgi:hypothetical protein
VTESTKRGIVGTVWYCDGGCGGIIGVRPPDGVFIMRKVDYWGWCATCAARDREMKKK